MDDRRFDTLVKSLASGTNRRTLLKGLLGLGGIAVAGSVALDGDTEAARRPTPTPTPVKCPGNQVPSGGTCVCPPAAPNKCGPDCCTSVAGGPPVPTHSECCDNACCFGTCYGEELCCPTNTQAGGSPPLASVCANGECCLLPKVCANGLCVNPTPTLTPTNIPTNTPTSTAVSPTNTPTNTPINTPATTTPPLCRPGGQDCNVNADCCSGICQSGSICAAVCAVAADCPADITCCCVGTGVSGCVSPGICGAFGGGVCLQTTPTATATPTCLALQADCNPITNLCCQDQGPTDCAVSEECVFGPSCCRPLGGACGFNCDCCGFGICFDDTCCLGEEDACTANAECCSNCCNAESGQCGFEPTGCLV